MSRILKIKCPTCELEFNYYDSKFRPFCCEKCKLIDLGQWLTESYTIAGKKIEKLEDGTIVDQSLLDEFEEDKEDYE